MIDIYVLLTARVPRPVSAMLFGLVTLSTFTVLLPMQDFFLSNGLLLPAVCAMLGYVAVVHSSMPVTLDRLTGTSLDHKVWTTFGLPFLVCVAAICAPTFEGAQRALSIALFAYTVSFVCFAAGLGQSQEERDAAKDETGTFRNAANWNVVRLVAMILGNEMLIRFGSPVDWIIAVSLGPIFMHYLMYWTILATDPQDEFESRD